MKPAIAIHENLARDEEVRGSSDRSFGFTFAGFFLLLGLWPIVRGGPPRTWAVALGVVFLAAALGRPGLLAPLNRLWLRVGLLLHRVVNPLVMGVMFYGVITPIGLVMRVLGRDPMSRQFPSPQSSHWLPRRAAEDVRRYFRQF